jgi:hypothetical protein
MATSPHHLVHCKPNRCLALTCTPEYHSPRATHPFQASTSPLDRPIYDSVQNMPVFWSLLDLLMKTFNLTKEARHQSWDCPPLLCMMPVSLKFTTVAFHPQYSEPIWDNPRLVSDQSWKKSLSPLYVIANTATLFVTLVKFLKAWLHMSTNVPVINLTTISFTFGCECDQPTSDWSSGPA